MIIKSYPDLLVVIWKRKSDFLTHFTLWLSSWESKLVLLLSLYMRHLPSSHYLLCLLNSGPYWSERIWLHTNEIRVPEFFTLSKQQSEADLQFLLCSGLALVCGRHNHTETSAAEMWLVSRFHVSQSGSQPAGTLSKWLTCAVWGQTYLGVIFGHEHRFMSVRL